MENGKSVGQAKGEEENMGHLENCEIEESKFHGAVDGIIAQFERKKARELKKLYKESNIQVSRDKFQESFPTSIKDCPLFMDCVEEELSEAQMRARVEKYSKFTEQLKKLEALAMAGACVLEHENGSVTFRLRTST